LIDLTLALSRRRGNCTQAQLTQHTLVEFKHLMNEDLLLEVLALKLNNIILSGLLLLLEKDKRMRYYHTLEVSLYTLELPNVQVCDATGVNSDTAVKNITILLPSE
jgi:hypothetical protein